jgi:hypothetical protein
MVHDLMVMGSMYTFVKPPMSPFSSKAHSSVHKKEIMTQENIMQEKYKERLERMLKNTWKILHIA